MAARNTGNSQSNLDAVAANASQRFSQRQLVISIVLSADIRFDNQK